MADFKDVIEEALLHDWVDSIKPWERDAIFKWNQHLHKLNKMIEEKKSKKYTADNSWVEHRR